MTDAPMGWATATREQLLAGARRRRWRAYLAPARDQFLPRLIHVGLWWDDEDPDVANVELSLCEAYLFGVEVRWPWLARRARHGRTPLAAAVATRLATARVLSQWHPTIHYMPHQDVATIVDRSDGAVLVRAGGHLEEPERSTMLRQAASWFQDMGLSVDVENGALVVTSG